MKRMFFRRQTVAAMLLAAGVTGMALGQENVALPGTARQSSNWGGAADIYPARNAIDGAFNNFQHTMDSQWPAWWEVDLGNFYDISFIVLYNRGDGCCQSRHRDLTVEIKDSPDEGATVLYTSPLLNPENVLGGGSTVGPQFITLNLLALTGGPIPSGTVVRVTRTPDFDFSGTGGQGNSGEPYLLQLGEVEVYTGDCPEPIAGSCDSMTITGPPGGTPGVYTVSPISQDSPIYYTYIADDGTHPPKVIGPLAESTAAFILEPGTWTISVKVGDSKLCPSEAPTALCAQQVVVENCTADPSDTRCDGMTIIPPHGGAHPGTYLVTAAGTDESGDEVVYTFSANNGVDPPLVQGARKEGSASFDLTAGSWTITAAVGDNSFCPPDDAPAARCTEVIQVKPLSDKPNVAPQGVTRQSTGYGGAGEGQFPSANAIDGVYTNFTHTASADDAALWEDDLGDSFAIEAIQIFNRADCCPYRMRDLTVTILDVDAQAVWTSDLLNPENVHPDGSGNPYNPARLTLSFLDLAGKPVDGRFVRIERAPDPDNSGAGSAGLPDDMNVLSMGEVEIFGAPSTLPANVVRDLAKETFSGAESVAVSLAATAEAAGTAVVLTEGLPPGASAGSISDGGVLAGDKIEWNLGPVTGTKTVSYQIAASSSCAGELRFRQSSFVAAGKKGVVRGESLLTRVVSDQGLGSWQSADIGPAGAAVEQIGDHEALVSTSGNGASGTSDVLRFVSIPQSGDFEITARIDCVDDPGQEGQAGLMVRDTLDPFSAHAFFFLNPAPPPGGGLGTLKALSRRETLAARNTSAIPITDRNVADLPIYLKLQRTGQKLTFHRSPDGVTYQEVASRDIGTSTNQVNLRTDTLVGLAAAAGSPTGFARFTFSQVSGPPFNAHPLPVFRRGDVDGNATVDISDPVNLLGSLFLGTGDPPCLEAGDWDNDGQLDITDAVNNLGYQFLGQGPSAEPGPTTCGADPSEPFLGCELGCGG